MTLFPRLALAGIVASVCAFGASAELPNDELTVFPMPPANPERIYLADPVMPHLVDGRVHVIDGVAMKVLGMLGTGFASQFSLSPDRSEIYVATTYHSRLQRGPRTDVLEVYDASNLDFKYEIELPPKHVQGLNIRAAQASTPDGRWLLIQNATPATSVTVVDVVQRKVAAEIATPGCYGIVPWPGNPRRFSAVCGDGTLSTIDLKDDGSLAGRTVSARFFDPDQDPVFMQYEFVGEKIYLVSYHGQVHGVQLSGAAPAFDAPWPLVPEAERQQGWAPGGYELFAIRPDGRRLYIGMHRHAKEGSHKNPAEQLWVYDLASHQRIARAPGQGAISMKVSRSEAPRLVLLDGEHNELKALDVRDDKHLGKPVATFANAGETPVYLELH